MSQSTTWRTHLPWLENLLGRVRRLTRESSRVAIELPVTISGFDELRVGSIFREATHTIDVSRRGAKLTTSNFLAVGSHLWIEGRGMQKSTVARVVRHGVRTRRVWETCVELPEVDGPDSVWGISSPPEDWSSAVLEPTAAKRLERVLARDWVARFQKVTAPPSGISKHVESKPQEAAANPKTKTPSSSSSKKRSGERPVSVGSRPDRPVKNSGRGVEESKRQPTRQAETEEEPLSQAARSMTSNLRKHFRSMRR